MNANELSHDRADILADELLAYHNKGVCGRAAKMLRQQQAENDELKATMRSFFEDFLNVREESDSGRVFAPITIGCCRVMMTEPLSNLLDKMRKLSGAKPPPKQGD